jgi:cell division protein FtsB
MNQIVDETGISKGKVHYLINDWKRKIATSDIDKIRDFTVLVRKSNMSIEQCAQDFRTTNILKNLGIHEGDDSVYVIDNDNKNFDNSQYNELSTFIQDIYLTCKNLGVTPSNILLWIKDLLDFQSNSDINIDRSSSLIEENNNKIDEKSVILDLAHLDYESNLDNNYDRNLKLKDDLPEQMEIPFISQISYYISQKKKEYGELENYQITLKEDIKKLELHKKTVVENLNLAIRKEKFATSYLKFFNKLKKELWENHYIKIEDNIQNFSYLINDFKEHGYRTDEIIKEYLKSISLKAQIITYEDNLQSMHKQRIDLIESISNLEDLVSQHKQTMNMHRELESMGFGFKEIKQLWNTILEITESNDISYSEAVSKFLNDIEKDYDNILGFEAKVKQKRDELVLMNKGLNDSRQNQWLTPLIGPSLSNLFQKGISEQDIIGINQLVEICIGSTNFSNYIIDPQNEKMSKGTNKGNKIISRSEY